MDANHPEPNEEYDDQPDVLNEHVQDPGDPDGLVAAEKQRMWREGQESSPPRITQADVHKRYWPVMLLVGLVLAAIVGAYFLGFRKASIPVAKKAQVAQNKAERKFAPPITATKHYDSTIFTLSIDYPDNWIVSDTAAKLTVLSPSFGITTQDGTTDGHVIVTIQNQQSNIAGFPSGGATASMESDKLTYKQPSGIQRSETYMSFLGYSGTSGIDALYLTGDSGYKKGQHVPMGDVAKGNPLINVTFVKCAKSYCSSGAITPETILASSWDKAAYRTEVINLLQSLVLN